MCLQHKKKSPKNLKFSCRTESVLMPTFLFPSKILLCFSFLVCILTNASLCSQCIIHFQENFYVYIQLIVVNLHISSLGNYVFCFLSFLFYAGTLESNTGYVFFFYLLHLEVCHYIWKWGIPVWKPKNYTIPHSFLRTEQWVMTSGNLIWK